MPSSQAPFIRATASSSDSPCPKKVAAEPIPPKFPQPRVSRRLLSLSVAGLRHLRFERREHLLDLLVHDRLEHPLPHAPDRPGDPDVRLPGHRRPAVGLAEAELR